jgi:hypothetical protein
MRSYHTIYIFIYGMDPFHKRTQDSSCYEDYHDSWLLISRMPNIESDMTVLIIIIINNRYACIPTIHGPAWPTRDIPTCIR